MESSVIFDKPPEYHRRKDDDDRDNEDSGFPFDEDSGSEDVWNDLAARHPDIAARIRAGRDGTWGPRKRRSSQQPDEFSRNVDDHFQGFPFDDIPPEFRQHFPSHWGERFSPRSTQQERHYQPQEKEVKVEATPSQSTPHPQTQETATQTADDRGGTTEPVKQSPGLPQYGLRNTVDLGQKTPAEPGQIDAEQARNLRSMSAPPDNRPSARPPQPQQHMGNTQQHQPQPQQPQQQQQQQQQHHQQQQQQPSVRHIPIFVEGRDEPVINKNVDHATNFGEPRVPSPQPPEREIPRTFNQPPHFSKAFGTPFKGFKQTPSPFGHTRGFQQQQKQDEAEIPKVFKPTSKSPPPPRQQQQPSQPQPQQTSQEQQKPPPQKQEPSFADPITKIQSIQKDVLDLMSKVEKFTGSGRKDKHYLYLDEMLTRNLIKLDDIDTEGKENIRQARKEAIKCIQKCIAVLEAKADAPTNPRNRDVTTDNPENNADAEMIEPASQEAQNVANDNTNLMTGQQCNETIVESMQQTNGEITDKKETPMQAVDTQCKTDANTIQADHAPMEVDQNASSQQ